MNVISPSFEILGDINWRQVEKDIEEVARTCYKSEDKITEGSAKKLISNLIVREHEAMLEHFSFSVRFICDRGISHELVRHRIASFAQESTRYVNYEGKPMKFILPRWLSEAHKGVWDYEEVEAAIQEDLGIYLDEEDKYTDIPNGYKWLLACALAEKEYNELIKCGWTPQQARSVLPNSLKTEIVVTANIREWRKIFSLRCDKSAHPQIRELMVPLYSKLAEETVLFKGVLFSVAKEDFFY